MKAICTPVTPFRVTPVRAEAMRVCALVTDSSDSVYRCRENKRAGVCAYDVIVKEAGDKRGKHVYTILADLL